MQRAHSYRVNENIAYLAYFIKLVRATNNNKYVR